MSSKTSLLILHISVILAITTSASNWQGQGDVNQTVMAKIWAPIDAVDLSTVYLPTFTKSISDSLNNEWDPAWNVIMCQTIPQKDIILYGYAFRNQWMWHNGIPLPGYEIYRYTLIVWKDYNCKDWKSLENIDSSFTTEQKNTIEEEAAKLTELQLVNDIWGSAHAFMTALTSKTGFDSPSNAYTIIMSQYGSFSINGYVCRVGNNYYDTRRTHYDGLFTQKKIGAFHFFQTRGS